MSQRKNWVIIGRLGLCWSFNNFDLEGGWLGVLKEVFQGNRVAYAKEDFGFVKVHLENFEAVWLLRKGEAKDWKKTAQKKAREGLLFIHCNIEYCLLKA